MEARQHLSAAMVGGLIVLLCKNDLLIQKY